MLWPLGNVTTTTKVNKLTNTALLSMEHLRINKTFVTTTYQYFSRLSYRRLLNVAARLVSDTRNFDRCLRQLMRVDLHWLGVPERVKFKLVSMVHNCIHHKAPWYLTDYCIPITDVASRWHLRSARRHYLVVPWHSLSLYGRQSFAIAGPTAQNSLSDNLRYPSLTTDSFRRLIKTRLLSEY